MEHDATNSSTSLYDTDFAEWSDRTAELLRAGRFQEIDIENVAEEIASLGRAERKAVRSQLQRLMMHRLKQQLQPERNGQSWAVSIANARDRILDEIEDAPSLERHLQENLQRVYRLAAAEALRETGAKAELPIECPWSIAQLLQR